MALVLALFAAIPAPAQTFPALSGRVVDAANLLDAQQRADLDAKLAGIEQASKRQVVVAMIPDLQGYAIEDYGYRLGRAWGIGSKQANDGVLLIVAPKDRKVRIEVGYGLEPYLTDALSSVIISTQILPRFRAGDYPGGIAAGADAIIAQLKLPEDQALARQQQMLSQAKAKHSEGVPVAAIFWGVVVLFVIVPNLFGRRRGRALGGLGQVVLWTALDELSRGGRGGGGGGWGGGDSDGGGGFSGGGGSFGGGGASGSW